MIKNFLETGFASVFFIVTLPFRIVHYVLKSGEYCSSQLERTTPQTYSVISKMLQTFFAVVGRLMTFIMVVCLVFFVLYLLGALLSEPMTYILAFFFFLGGVFVLVFDKNRGKRRPPDPPGPLG